MSEEVEFEVLKAHLLELKKHSHIILPEGASKEFENNGGYAFNISTDHPYEFNVSSGTYGSWHKEKEGQEYFSLSLDGFFGEDEYVQTCLEDLTDEECMRFQPAPADKLEALDKYAALVSLIGEAVKAAEDFSTEHKLGQEIEWSTDSGTIAEWNSSRC